MGQPENKLSVSLPENLKRQFSLLEKRLWKVETSMAVCSGSIGLIFSYRIWNSPVWFRVLVLTTALLIFGWSALRWMKLWIFQRRDLRALSDLVQRKFRRLGDRLLGIVELSNEKTRPVNFSPELYH